jgi:formylglycine-generating enzyme required for sulfatase activity
VTRGVAERVPHLFRRDGFDALSQITVELALDSARSAPPSDVPFLRSKDFAFEHLAAVMRDGVRLPELLRLPHGRWVILGEPGSGKTTLLKWFARWLQDHTAHVVLYAKVQHLAGTTLSALLTRLLPDDPAAAPALQRALQAGQVVLLLDGLDEALDPAAARATLTALDAQLDRCMIVVSSRPVAYDRPAQAFRELAVRALEPDQQLNLLTAWLPDLDPQRLREELLALQRHPRMGPLVANPLLLTLLARVLRRGAEAPRRRVDLYRDVVRRLLTSDLDPDRPAPEDARDLEDALAWLALQAHGRADDALTREVLTGAMQGAPEAVVEVVRRHGGPWPLAAEIARCSALLEPDRHVLTDVDAYTFAHRTLREYLAALALRQDIDRHGLEGSPELRRVLKLATRRPGLWAEVLALTCGLVGSERADALVRLVQEVEAAEVGRAEPRPAPATPPVVSPAPLAPAEPWWRQGVRWLLGWLLPQRIDPPAPVEVHEVEQEPAPPPTLARHPLLYRVLADAEGLRPSTLLALLGLDGGREAWEARCDLIRQVPTVVDDLAVATRLLMRIAETTTQGAELWWVRRLLRDIAAGTLHGTVDEGSQEALREEAARLAEAVLRLPTRDREADRQAALAWAEEHWRTIPRGRFWMGGPGYGEGRFGDGPRHEVEVLTDYELGAVPVTNQAYAWLDPEHEAAANPGRAEHPVANVSWWEADFFAAWLDAAQRDAGRGGLHLRLPSEEEWERGARGGTDTPYLSGSAEAAVNLLVWAFANSEPDTHPVGLPPTGAELHPFGLHDVNRNVWEWSGSTWSTYQVAPRTHDPSTWQPPEDPDAARVFRGGTFVDVPRNARSAFRLHCHPANRDRRQGFRLLRVRRVPQRS